ncbi:MAG: hypothetical protein ACXADY_02920 [Candidatus Hodarchaeales archaeon]|jgi:hypothetical protein
MSDSKADLGVIIILLVVVVAGYQAITQIGNFLAEEVFRIAEVEFWTLLFVGLLAFVVIVLGVSLRNILDNL